MNLASSDKSSGNGRAATRASYGSNSFEHINQSKKSWMKATVNWFAILHYILAGSN